MGYKEARELARIRQTLRERLMSQRGEDVTDILERLRQVAENEEVFMPELRNEYERWKLRFDLLAAFAG
jgi:hypothetical protein